MGAISNMGHFVHPVWGATSRSTTICSRLRTRGGPLSGKAADENKRDMENVEQGGEAATAMYSPAAQRCNSGW
eukprot:6000049-Pleurochrysis_carterae.AAC.1